jgi:glycosyltransferase involved in cell wall biosynthesis
MLRVLFVALTENDTMRGVERYALELVRALATHHSSGIRLTLLCGSWQRYFDELRSLDVEILTAPTRNRKLSRHLFLLTRMRSLSARFDLVHYGNLLPVSLPNRTPSTMTIHDVAEYALSGKYSAPQALYRKLVGLRARHSGMDIAADSLFTRDEIVRYLAIPRDRITVIYPGVDHFRDLAPHARIDTGHPYVLYYGVIEETKGADTAVLAFRQLLNEGTIGDLRLLLIGKKGNAFTRVSPLIDGDRIVYLGFQEDAQLQAYIRGASAVIFVSRYEGFGLPAIESYMLNDHIIASRGNSVGEITRGFALQVDEHSVDAVAAAIRDVHAGKMPIPSLTRESVLARFSWSAAAEQMLALFERAAARKVRKRSGDAARVN